MLSQIDKKYRKGVPLGPEVVDTAAPGKVIRAIRTATYTDKKDQKMTENSTAFTMKYALLSKQQPRRTHPPRRKLDRRPKTQASQVQLQVHPDRRRAGAQNCDQPRTDPQRQSHQDDVSVWQKDPAWDHRAAFYSDPADRRDEVHQEQRAARNRRHKEAI